MERNTHYQPMVMLAAIVTGIALTGTAVSADDGALAKRKHKCECSWTKPEPGSSTTEVKGVDACTAIENSLKQAGHTDAKCSVAASHAVDAGLLDIIDLLGAHSESE